MLSWIIGVIAIVTLSRLYVVYADSTEFPTLSNDCIKLILTGMAGMIGMIAARILLQTKKGINKPMIANQFEMPTTLYDAIYATACNLVPQVIVLLLMQAKLFEVATADVYAFYISAAVMEEFLYRGCIIMWTQGLLARIIKPKNEADALPINIFCIILSGAIFMAAHTGYYGNLYLMMAVLLGGLSQGFWYLKSKNLLVVIVAHIGINFSASGSVVQSLN